ncbi:hypothetical protein [Catenuloplanes japonicus]|uniref:hypothetical protein n=1 Tax=Catenuloplanes japonicus TaxID=33876 RepID=UPI0005248D4C|nr:hypothetical protein [Catenuloplanes japonicus]
MSILRIVRDEAAGAWRSLQYDLDRRGTETPRYPGYDWYEPPTEDLSGAVRPPRRLLAAGAFGVLALVGAAGTYVTVANSLDSVLKADAGAPRSAPEIPGVPSPEPSPAPSLLAQAPVTPDGLEPWTTSATVPLPADETATGAAPTARGVATVPPRAARVVEAAPTPTPVAAGSPSLTSSPSGSPGASFPVPTPTSPPEWPGSQSPDQIPDGPGHHGRPHWAEWPDEPDFPPAHPGITESMTPAPGVDGTGPGSADGTAGGPNTPKDGTAGTTRANAARNTGY